jgi:hypothetical protein
MQPDPCLRFCLDLIRHTRQIQIRFRPIIIVAVIAVFLKKGFDDQMVAFDSIRRNQVARRYRRRETGFANSSPLYNTAKQDWVMKIASFEVIATLSSLC